MAIITRYSLFLTELRYSSPARIKAWKGEISLKSGAVVIDLHEGETFVVPPFVRFACTVYPRPYTGSARPAVWSLDLEHACSLAMERAAETGKPWTRQLAAAMFRDPKADWSATAAARLFAVTPSKLCRFLFAEGASLRSLVREQRVLWTLARLAQTTGESASYFDAGFSSARAMRIACQDTIGLPPEAHRGALSLLSRAPYPVLVTPINEDMNGPRYRPYF